jgi:hypothetical protein
MDRRRVARPSLFDLQVLIHLESERIDAVHEAESDNERD